MLTDTLRAVLLKNMCICPIVIKNKKTGERMRVACGKCVECSMLKAEEWAYRITYESSLYEHNCMLTLTYENSVLPKGGTLVLKHLQDFMKRLRKRVGKVRFFACGEYGESPNGTHRPHYHIILFGYDFPNRYFWKSSKKGMPIYRSDLLEDLWLYGFSTISEVEFDTCKYCALYLQKQPTDGRKKPFQVMSRRPGIGADAVKPKWLDSDKMYLRGRWKKLPRYFLDVLSRLGYADQVEIIKEKRSHNVKPIPDQHDVMLFSKEEREKFFEDVHERYRENLRRRKKFENNLRCKLDSHGRVVYNNEDDFTMRKSH